MVGNGALQEIGRVLQKTFRQTDIVARYGGDEFAVILPGTNLKQAQAIAERLQEGIAVATLPAGGLTVSIGMATYPSDATDIQGLIQLSDAALYQAKNSGRNKVQTFSG